MNHRNRDERRDEEPARASSFGRLPEAASGAAGGVYGRPA